MRFVLPALLMLAACSAEQGVPRNDDGLRYLGRYHVTDDGRREMGWPGSGVEFSYSGSALDLPIEDDGRGYMDVEVDGVSRVLDLEPGRTLYRIDDPDGDGRMSVRVTRRSESYDTGTFSIEPPIAVGEGRLGGAADRDLRILFLGDSITAGFGVAGDTKECANTPALHAPTESYAVLAAEQLNADFQLVAISGRGVIHNWDYNPEPVMPEQLAFALPDRPDTRWDSATFTPDVIVTLLGTNDWSAIDPGRDRFRSGYRDMLAALRADYPDAHIVTVSGPLLGGEQGAAIRDGIDFAMDALNDPKISTLDMQLVEHGLKWSCNYHPGRDSMAFMANALSEHIAGQLGRQKPEAIIRTPPSGWDKGPAHFEKRVAEIRALPEREDATLLLGDSITEAWLWQDVQPDGPVLNHGVSGDSTIGLLNRWPLIAETKPARVLIMIGTNDLSGQTPIETIAANVDNLVERLQAKHPDADITLQAIFPREVDMRERVDALNARYKGIASARDIGWLDMSDVFSDNAGKLRSELTEDDLHLNADGYALWAEQLRLHDNR